VRPRVDDASPAGPAADRARRIGGIVVGLIVALAALFAVYRDRHSVADTIQRVGPGATAASFAIGLLGVAATFPTWRQVLTGLGVRLPVLDGTRVFFVSQLGKYIPGSVWPVLLQMEAARRRGASRRTVLAANLITVVLSCTVGLFMASALLPLSDATALRRYWWVLLALVPLLILLHPRAMTSVLDRTFSLLHRAPLGERISVRQSARAGGWSVLSWLGLGVHVWLLCAAAGHGGFGMLLLCTGGMALAVAAGILFIPAPAGVGLREVILLLVLRPELGPGPALAVVVASRVLLVVGDVVLAGLAVVASTVRNRRKTS
jgi:uncharacterized membrane protein YbhN (UPF0104 family)